jgi:signal transduction histidine kinase
MASGIVKASFTESRKRPFLYQTAWFQTLGVAAFLGMLCGLYWYRMRRLAHEFNVRLEERVTERTRIARELHDTLLQSFQGSLFEVRAARNLFPRRPDDADFGRGAPQRPGGHRGGPGCHSS